MDGGLSGSGGLRLVRDLLATLFLFPLLALLTAGLALWPGRLPITGRVVRLLGFRGRAGDVARLRFVGARLAARLERRRLAVLLYPFIDTLPRCLLMAVADLRRTGEDRWPTVLRLFLGSPVPALRYAQGVVHPHWFLRERRSHAPYHLPNSLHITLCYYLNHRLNPDLPREQRHFDKVQFFLRCRAERLPTFRVVAAFEDGRVTRFGDPGAESLLSKPSRSTEGIGEYRRWLALERRDGVAAAYRSDDGGRVSADELFDHLATKSKDGPVLLQELGWSHDEIARLSGTDTLCTLRIPTCRFPDGEVAILPLTFLRMPTRETVFDNMAQGGIAYRVEARTGILGAGARYRSFEAFSTHPASGRLVVGCRLPFWEEVLELCRRAHAVALPSYPTLGWDVAITNDGPRLVEANIQWATEHGIPGEGFLGETPYVECLLAHLGRLGLV